MRHIASAIAVLVFGVSSACRPAPEESFDSFAARACAYLNERQAELERDYRISARQRYDWDQEKGTLVFSDDGKPVAIAHIQFVGDVSTISRTWLWSWANDTIDDKLKTAAREVQQYGAERSYERLTTAQWAASEGDGWEMTSVAALLCNAKGAYRTVDDNGAEFMIITDISLATGTEAASAPSN